MFSNMQLGTKIAAGFSALIIIALALGGLAVIKMKGVVAESRMLGDEYVPEVNLSNDLGLHTYRSRYSNLGYVYTHDGKYLDEARAAMVQVRAAVVEADKLAARSPHLVQLKGALDDVKKTFNEYERLMGEMEKTVMALDNLSTQMSGDGKNIWMPPANILKIWTPPCSDCSPMTRRLTYWPSA